VSAEIISPKIDMQWIPPVVTLPNSEKYERSWYLAKDFIVTWVENNKTHRLIVKKGMPTDGASTPQVLWSFGFLPTGTEFGGAVVHDAAYQVQGDLDKSPWLELYYYDFGKDDWVRESGVKWSRLQCDDYFYRFMLQGGANRAKAWVMFQAVRAFGYWAWEKLYPFNESSIDKGSP
jgi:hypothetical protein